MKKIDIKKYILMSFWNAFIVYMLYTPYVFLWLRFNFEQYAKWLIGGLPMALAIGWLIVRLNVWASNKYDRTKIEV